MREKRILEPAKGGDQNILGGRNPHGLYVPMSDDEQEVIARLVEADDLRLIIHGWAVLGKPHLIVGGDLRVGVRFRLDFPDGMAPVQVPFLDLELRRSNGQTVFREKKALGPAGQAPIAAGGAFFELQWDIAIHSMDPAFVKAIKPGARGLTSRRIDRDTGARTAEGNMQLDSTQKAALAHVEAGAEQIRKEDAAAAAKAEKPER